jgi:hypothetical protein
MLFRRHITSPATFTSHLHQLSLRALFGWGDGVPAALFASQFPVGALEAHEDVLIVNPSFPCSLSAIGVFGCAPHNFQGVGRLTMKRRSDYQKEQRASHQSFFESSDFFPP